MVLDGVLLLGELFIAGLIALIFIPVAQDSKRFANAFVNKCHFRAIGKFAAVNAFSLSHGHLHSREVRMGPEDPATVAAL